MKNENENEVLCKPKTKMKWVILILASMALMGDYYCFDNPGAMHNLLLKRFANPGDNFEYTFNLLYSVYSLPNIILPLIGGLLIFKFGYRLMFLIFGFCVLLGQLIFAVGCSTKSIGLMLTGRVIFGLGGESLNTTQYSIIVQWFAANELAFALGMCLSLARLGNVLNDVISPRIATTADVCSAMWVGFAICSFSFLCTILLVYLDWRQDILIQMNEIVHSRSAITFQESEKDKEKSLFALNNLPRIFMLLNIYIVLMYGGILPFNYIATSFLIRTWYNNDPTTEAQHNVGMAMALPFLISSFLIPLIGISVDKYGKRANLLIYSSAIGVVTYIMFIYCSPILPLILLGFTYSIFASVVWPTLSLIIPKDIIGIAFGFATSLQNLGLVFFPLIIAFIFTNTQSYDITLLFFIFLLLMALVLAIFINIENRKHENILNMAVKQDYEKLNETFISKNNKSKGILLKVEKNEEERIFKIKEYF